MRTRLVWSELIMSKYDLVIFDVDGTLLDTTESVVLSAKHAITTKGYDMPSDSVLLKFIGPPLQVSFENLFGLKGKERDEAVAIFREFYAENMLRAKPYDGMLGLCEYLREKGIAMAIATYKREDYALKILSHFGFADFTDNIHGAAVDNTLTKHDIIEKCIEESGVSDRSRIVMIGDTLHDANGAEQSGVDFIGVTYGFGFAEERPDNLKYADTAEAITDIIEG